jgi:hypothetical protein
MARKTFRNSTLERFSHARGKRHGSVHAALTLPVAMFAVGVVAAVIVGAISALEAVLPDAPSVRVARELAGSPLHSTRPAQMSLACARGGLGPCLPQ